MAFWDDLSRWAGNLTGGFIGESDEERRRRRQQQQSSNDSTGAAPSVRKPASTPTQITPVVETPKTSLQLQANTADRSQPKPNLRVQQRADRGFDLFVDGQKTDIDSYVKAGNLDKNKLVKSFADKGDATSQKFIKDNPAMFGVSTSLMTPQSIDKAAANQGRDPELDGFLRAAGLDKNATLTADNQALFDVYKTKVGDAIEQQRSQRGRGSWLDNIFENITDSGWEDRARQMAINQALNEVRAEDGSLGENQAVLDSMIGEQRQQSKASQDAIENTKTAVDVIRLLPMAGIGELGANALRGNFSGTREADDTILREQTGMSQAEINAIDQLDAVAEQLKNGEITKEQLLAAGYTEDEIKQNFSGGLRDKMLNMSKVGLGAGVLDLAGLGAGSLVRSVGKGTLQQSLKLTTKQLTKAALKNSAVSGTVGAGLGYGGSKMLGTDDAAAAENAVSGFLTGAFAGAAGAPIDAAISSYMTTRNVTRSQAKQALKTYAEAAQDAEGVDSSTKAALANIVDSLDTETRELGETPNVEAPKIETPTETPNVPKTEAPEVTSTPTTPVEPEVNTQTPSNPINAEPITTPTNDTTPEVVQSTDVATGEVRSMTPQQISNEIAQLEAVPGSSRTPQQIAQLERYKRELGTFQRQSGNNLFDGTDIRSRLGQDRTELYRSQNPESAAAVAQGEINQRVASLPDDEYVRQMADRFGMKPEVVQRLLTRTNKAQLFNTLNQSGEFIRGADSPDAAATSVLNRSLAQGEAAARRGGVATTQNGKQVPDAGGKAVYSDINSLSKDAKNSLENDQTGMKPGGVERSGARVENASAKPVEYRRLEDGSIVIQDGRHTLEYARRNGITDYPMRDVTDEFNAAANGTTTRPDSGLGTMVDSFYQSRKGDTPIKFREVRELGRSVARQIDADFRAIGSNTADVFKRVQAAANKKGGTIADAKLNPDELQVLRNLQAEMNQVRRRASLGRRDIGSGDLGELYLPRAAAGESRDFGSLLEGFRSIKPGNENKRTGTLQLDEIDYTADSVGSYITRYADTKLTNQERIRRSLEQQYPDVDEAKVNQAAGLVAGMQDRINNIKRGAFGSKNKTSVDSVKEMSDIGHALGAEQTVITQAPKASLTIGDRVNSVEINGQTAGDYFGLNQFRDAGPFSRQQFAEVGGDRKALAESVQKRLTEVYDLPEERVTAYAEQVGRIADSVPDEVAVAKLEQVYRQAAKEQFMSNAQRVDIKNNRLRSDVSTLANQQLRGGTIENTAGRKIVNAINMARNASFRKLNVGSAINELSDLPGYVSTLGMKNVNWVPLRGTVEKWGLGVPNPAIEPYVRMLEQANGNWGSVKDALKSANDLTNFYHAVEHYKAGVFLDSAEKFYRQAGLEGDALTRRVLDDYRELVLPVDEFTRTFLDNAPLFTQYLTWQARNMRKEYRLATGQIDAGVLKDKSQMARIARNAYANMPAKTALWLSSNGLKGTALITAFGLMDITGASSGDFSGIQEEDKTAADRTVNWIGNISPFGSLLADVYNGVRRDQLKNEYADEDYNPYKDADLGSEMLKDVVMGHIPGNSQVSRTLQAAQEQQQGYTETKDGRIRYQTANDPLSIAQGLLFGNSTTAPGREYSGNPTAVQRMQNGENPIAAVGGQVKTDSTVNNIVDAATGEGTREYNRPLTNSAVDGGYNKAARDAYAAAEAKYGQNSTEARAVLDKWIGLGRKYNKTLDDFRRNNPEGYANWERTFDDNIISPEKWQIYQTNPDVFKFTKERKQMEASDLGRPLDPIYKLSNTAQLKDILAIRSAYTGDSTEREEILKATAPWYNQFVTDQRKYYEANTEFYSGLNDEGGNLSERQAAYLEASQPVDQPALVKRYFEIMNSDGKDAAKAWGKTQGDALSAQFDEYSDARLARINAMREIEGVDPISKEVFDNSTFGFNATGSGWSYGGKSGTNNYLEALLTNYGKSSGGIKTPTLPQRELVDVTKVAKYPRASGQSKIRIRI